MPPDDVSPFTITVPGPATLKSSRLDRKPGPTSLLGRTRSYPTLRAPRQALAARRPTTTETHALEEWR
jgi:hypothetical protein